jgi:hypothetical protein
MPGRHRTLRTAKRKVGFDADRPLQTPALTALARLGSRPAAKARSTPVADYVARSGPKVSLAPALPADGADDGYAIVWREEERTQFTPPNALRSRLIGDGALRRPLLLRGPRNPGVGRNREDGERAGDAAQQNAPRYVRVKTARQPSSEIGGAILTRVVGAQCDCPNSGPGRSRRRPGGRSVRLVRFGEDLDGLRRRQPQLRRRRTHCETDGADGALRPTRPGRCRVSLRGRDERPAIVQRPDR